MMIVLAPRKAAVLFFCALPLCALLTIPLARLEADTFDKPPFDKLIEADHWKRAPRVVSERLRATPNDARAPSWPEARLLLAQTARKDKGNFSQAMLIVPPDRLAAGR